MALPREVREASKLNGLGKGLGESCLTDLQEVSERPPKPSSTTGEKPDLLVDAGDLPATARDVRDLLAESGCLFDRGVPVKVVSSPDCGPLTAFRLNGADSAHGLTRHADLPQKERAGAQPLLQL
jgi:hypothetical protein